MRERKMDEEHSRESLPEDGMDAENTREKEHGTEENSVTKSITEHGIQS